MSKKKYQIYTSQEDNSWTAGITRRVSKTKSVVTKSQQGFTSEAEATAWAETELQALLKVQAERNKRHAR
ncbi:MAG: DUF3622 domain-containing protein [Gammaproteobacteria bacterium]|nr:DUF3622 domain-containing protein [Gammaproteobacteria bacterium]